MQWITTDYVLSDWNKPLRYEEVGMARPTLYAQPKYDGELWYIQRLGGKFLISNKHKTTYSEDYWMKRGQAEFLIELRNAIPIDCIVVAEGISTPGHNTADAKARDMFVSVSHWQSSEFGEHKLGAGIFDIVELDGKDLRGLKFSSRFNVLQKLVKPTERIRLAQTKLFTKYEDMANWRDSLISEGWEGIVVKSDEPYHFMLHGKMKRFDTDDFAVIGVKVDTKEWIEKGIAHSFAIGKWDAEKKGWMFCGFVGNGLSNTDRANLTPIMKANQVTSLPMLNRYPAQAIMFVNPTEVFEISYQDQTVNGMLREHSIIRIREDKRPVECV